MQRITKIIENGMSRYDALPPAVRRSALPYVLASLPIFLSSIAGAHVVMPVVVGLTVVLLFHVANTTDEFMFELSKQQARLLITMPLCGFISAWVIVLAMLSRKAMMNGVVGPYCILLLIACAPAFRWNSLRTKRRVPLWISFGLAGVFAVSGSLVHAF